MSFVSFFPKTPLKARLGDLLFYQLSRAFSVFTLLILGGIIASLFVSALPSIHAFGWGFLWRADWNPPAERFGALVPIYGTLMTSAIALFIALPISFGIAVFLTELSPAYLKRPLGLAIELLAGIPSIVYGIWGLLVFAPLFSEYGEPFLSDTVGKLPLVGAFFQGAPYGIGILAAGMILAIMIIPFIASVMRDVFELTPPIFKESAYGLGATTWEVVWHVVLPYTKTGVIGGVMLGLGRALGETMAVTFVIGNASQWAGVSLFAPGNSMTSVLANEFSEASPRLYTAALMELGLILFLMTFVVLSLSKLLLYALEKKGGIR